MEQDQRKVKVSHRLLVALTIAAVLILGYHPFAEDGGVYAAGIKYLLHPNLYSHYTDFVTEHLRFSIFAPAAADLTKVLHVGLPWVLFLLYAGSLWALMKFSWMIASHCFTDAWARAGATALMAAWCGLPVAGTSLMLMDPYVTARSLATPLLLGAVATALEYKQTGTKSIPRCIALLFLTALLHPLMAGYGLGFVALLFCTQSLQPLVRRWGPAALGGVAILIALAVQLTSARENAAQHAVALTRYYWFPFQWEIYEQIGLIAPLLVIAVLARFSLRSESAAALSRATIWLGAISSVVAILFSRAGLASHAVARLQPLRCYMMVYAMMILLLGGWIAERWLRSRWITACVAFALAGFGLFFGQRQYYPASAHLEMPWRASRNDWVKAFEWARANTPDDALFALDANYITTDGEDAQCFRAIAERSAVPDYSKDGGEASITPTLIGDWTLGSGAQKSLSNQSDVERAQRLSPLGVSWLVLKKNAATVLTCPYKNETVKICRLR